MKNQNFYNYIFLKKKIKNFYLLELGGARPGIKVC